MHDGMDAPGHGELHVLDLDLSRCSQTLKKPGKVAGTAKALVIPQESQSSGAGWEKSFRFLRRRMKQTTYTLRQQDRYIMHTPLWSFIKHRLYALSRRMQPIWTRGSLSWGTWRVLVVNLASQAEGAPFLGLFHSIWGQDRRTSAPGKAT